MECLSSQGQRGGNSSCQESKLPRVQPRAGSGKQDSGCEPGVEGGPGGGRRPRAPAEGDGRAENKWFGGYGRDPTAPTFPPRGG